MKISCFHPMPYRDLPDDFDKTHDSGWFTLPFEGIGDRKKVAQYNDHTLLSGMVRE